MHRVAIGLRVSDSTTGNIRFEGCDSPPDMNGVRACSADVELVNASNNVDEAVSFTMGPFTSPAAPIIARTLYVVVEGSIQVPGATTLNPTTFQNWCVGTIEIDAPAGTAGEPPVFVVDGLDQLPYHDITTVPWQTSTTLLDAVLLEDVVLASQFNSGDDLDNDGELDTADNCIFIGNPGLANNGDLLLTGLNLDSDGDACECGDADGSGGVFNPDLQLIREHLVGLNPGTAAAVESICSVFEGIDCDTKDAVVLERALNAQLPGVAARCDAALPD